MQPLTCRMKEFIRPFERRLALQELRALTGGRIVPLDGDDATALTFAITEPCNADTLRATLAYWYSVGDTTDGLTNQLRSEATSLVARNAMPDEQFMDTVRSLVPFSLPNRRCLRYATHGLHEYRGKFFPQLVRALMNVANLRDGAVVLDSMCGSGTTLVEAKLSGKRAYGLDINPLSVFVSNVKCESLALRPSGLMRAYDNLRAWLDTPSYPERGRTASLSDHDQSYLVRWFDLHCLRELDQIDAAIRRLPSRALRDFYLVCLSNILRRVSWQKNEDLRVRRQENSPAPGESVKGFLEEALRSTKVVASFLVEREASQMYGHHVQQADARHAKKAFPHLSGFVDAVITSPPYATALPYIDTDRLSLIYLGLSSRKAHRTLDSEMIGNREVSGRDRNRYWAHYEEHKKLLPAPTRSMIERIDDLNRNSTAGFRRKNLSALLAKYFFDMREAMQQTLALLKPGGTMFLVIGNNRTLAGGQRIDISTADHLSNLAQDIGFRLASTTPMDMLVSRDIFSRNAMPSEQILRLDKPQ